MSFKISWATKKIKPKKLLTASKEMIISFFFKCRLMDLATVFVHNTALCNRALKLKWKNKIMKEKQIEVIWSQKKPFTNQNWCTSQCKMKPRISNRLYSAYELSEHTKPRSNAYALDHACCHAILFLYKPRHYTRAHLNDFNSVIFNACYIYSCSCFQLQETATATMTMTTMKTKFKAKKKTDILIVSWN